MPNRIMANFLAYQKVLDLIALLAYYIEFAVDVIPPPAEKATYNTRIKIDTTIDMIAVEVTMTYHFLEYAKGDPVDVAIEVKMGGDTAFKVKQVLVKGADLQGFRKFLKEIDEPRREALRKGERDDKEKARAATEKERKEKLDAVAAKIAYIQAMVP